MTKKEIVRVISEELGLTQQQTKEVVQRTFDSIVEMLVREGRVELRNFGVFEVKLRAARSARNPKTSQQVHVPEKYVVSFKPGKEMEQRVQNLSEQPGRPAWLDPDYEPEGSPPQPTADSTEHPARSTHSQNLKSAREADHPNRPTGDWA
ncbi:HU family DNA-binding protein [Allorhodopirellula solitaria]|uniref:HU family DNA-binding protein n=1 Tax=Allorhodopirellula solitaria TaxID=2527987 RepID=UPI0011B73AE5|nr:HU family DNA-binding protein [Allorhodopirellula solitaria]